MSIQATYVRWKDVSRLQYQFGGQFKFKVRVQGRGHSGKSNDQPALDGTSLFSFIVPRVSYGLGSTD